MKNVFLASLASVVWMGITMVQPELLAEGLDTVVIQEETIAAPQGVTTFETLTISGQVLRRATVFERTADMVYLKHDGGLRGIRVAELDGETRRLLGYESQTDVKAAEGSFRRGRDKAEEMAARMGGWATPGADLENGWGAGIGLVVLSVVGLMSLLGHLLISYLLRMICRKANSPPGFLIWLPVLQVFPLLQAAGISRRWPLAIVVLSLIGILLMGISLELALLVSMCSSLLALGLSIAWSIKICLARGKSPGWAVLLLLPGLNFIGLVYLAASE
jgi:hypothetical protein